MRIVHVKGEPFTHYIGRGWMPTVPKGKVQPAHANLGNKFAIGDIGPEGTPMTREGVIKAFEMWLRLSPEAKPTLERIKALPEEAVLGCWCKPRACHGDVIAKLWKEMHS